MGSGQGVQRYGHAARRPSKAAGPHAHKSGTPGAAQADWGGRCLAAGPLTTYEKQGHCFGIGLYHTLRKRAASFFPGEISPEVFYGRPPAVYAAYFGEVELAGGYEIEGIALEGAAVDVEVEDAPPGVFG